MLTPRRCFLPAGANRFPISVPPLADGLYALWLPTLDPRMWFNPWRLNAKRATIPFEYSPA